MTDKKKPLDTRNLESSQGPAEGAEAGVTPPGEMLKQARVAAKLSEQDVARELRMTVTKVRFLEADDYENLHSDTFVRGYLRTYAKLLGIDPTVVLSAYADTRRAAGWDGSADENPIQVNLAEPSRPLWRFAILIIILLVGLWALSVWFLGNQQDDSTDSALVDPLVEMTSLQTPSEPAESGSSDDTAQLQSPSAERSEGDAGGSVEATTDSEPEDPSVSDAATNAPSETLAVGPEVEALASTDTRAQTGATDPEALDQLRMEFDEECWVEVVDSRGDVLQADLLSPGRVLTLAGEAPFDVKIGNAAAVSIELNGEPFAFSVPNNRRTLTLEVN